MRNIWEFPVHQHCFHARQRCDVAVIETVSSQLKKKKNKEKNEFFYFRRMILKTVKNMQNSDCQPKNMFYCNKFLCEIWQKQAIYEQTRQIISKTKKEAYLKTSDFDLYFSQCSTMWLKSETEVSFYASFLVFEIIWRVCP